MDSTAKMAGRPAHHPDRSGHDHPADHSPESRLDGKDKAAVFTGTEKGRRIGQSDLR